MSNSILKRSYFANAWKSPYQIKFTFKNIKKMTPCWPRNCAFSPSMTEILCLFSSHVPCPFSFDGILKLAEVHHEFLTHWWPHDNRLPELNRLTTCPLRRLFSCVVKNDEEEEVDFSCTAKTTIDRKHWNRIENKMFAFFIVDKRSQYAPREWNWPNKKCICSVRFPCYMKFAIIALRNKTWLVSLRKPSLIVMFK